MHSFRIKITMITVATILVSILAFVGVGFSTVGNEMEHNSTQVMNLLCENMKQSLDEYLESVKQSVEMVSHIAIDSLDSVVLVEGGVAGVTASQTERTKIQEAELDIYLREHCDQVQEAFNSVANHTSGVVTYFYCIAPEISKSEHGFFYSKLGKMNFDEQSPLDAKDLDPEDLEHNAWYFTAVQRGRPSWIGPYKAGNLDDMWTVSYITPIYKAGTLVGVLGMDILFETMVSKIQSLKLYDTGFACLFDNEGNLLYHPTIEMGSSLAVLGLDIGEELYREKSSGDTLIRYSLDGVERQMSFATLASGMKLAVTAPVREINSAWVKMINFFVFIAAAVLFVFAIVTMLIMGAVTKPLLVLSSASQRLATGDYDVELSYNGNDEVGVLTESFRQMRDHLKLYISDLNSRVYKDALTGVKNKAAYDVSAGRLNDQIRHGSGRDEVEFALVMFDCNCLKWINDEFGHEKGDIYLQSACRAICKVFAHSPVFRLGGDEFAAMLQGPDYVNRHRLMVEFDETVEGINSKTNDPWAKVNISKGMSKFRKGEDIDVEQVLRRADARMYEDKRRSKLQKQAAETSGIKQAN